MRRYLAAAAVAAAVGLGGVAVAGAAETSPSWVDEALAGLVSDGTIDQAQSDAVETALAAARPAHGPGMRAGPGLDTAAEALGITADELRTALRDGQTIAEVAEAQGVELQTVIDAVVAEHQERIAQHVEDGRITQEQADERLADVEEHVTAMVNGEMPAGGMGMGRGGHHGMGRR